MSKSDIVCENKSCENFDEKSFNNCRTKFILCGEETYRQIEESREKIQALEKENNAFKEYIKNKSDIIKSYDEYKNSNLAIIIDADEKLSQEFDDVFNAYKIFRDGENKLLVEKLEKAKNVLLGVKSDYRSLFMEDSKTAQEIRTILNELEG